jgi:sterol desaturase/sphingolipid hydroxylase (fatty acid hydroxylase superfamily)
VGIRPSLILVCGGLNLIYQFWIHTELVDRMPRWFEFVFNTPSHHRVHHGSNPQYLDRNHGGILIVWDRLFGTFEPERERVVYGLTKDIRTFNPLRIFSHEIVAMFGDAARARSWGDRFRYVFRGPAWTPREGER